MANPVRVSQISTEAALESDSNLVRVSQISTEAATDNADSPVRVSQISTEVAVESSGNEVRVSQISIEAIIHEPIPCVPVEYEYPGSIASRYYAILRDQSGFKVAIFDDWLEMEFARIVDGLDYFVMTLRGDDSRRDLFELDGMFEIYRSVPGCGVIWYREFVGLFRTKTRTTNERGESIFKVVGLGTNDLLSRTTIMYKAESAQTDKTMASERAMKEYVDENCGPQATTANGRLLDGVLPNFQTEVARDNGALWVGQRAFENLLDVLREIANYSEIDFNVDAIGYPLFEFRTYESQLGSDRTIGNMSGNQPVVFSIDHENVSAIEYSYDRANEANVVTIVGGGSGGTRITVSAVANDTVDDSPWNRRELCRGGGNQDLVQMAVQAVEELVNSRGKETLSFIPIQQSSSLYGKHYFLGDRVTVIEDGVRYNKRLIAMKATISNMEEKLSFEFGDVV